MTFQCSVGTQFPVFLRAGLTPCPFFFPFPPPHKLTTVGFTPTETAFISAESFTQKEFKHWLEERPKSDINHYQLLRGKIVMNPPAVWPHAPVGVNIIVPLGTFVRIHQLGVVLDSSAGYDFPSGDTVEPDISFISTARLVAGPTPQPGKFVRIVPNLIVEILSPTTARRDRREKKVTCEETAWKSTRSSTRSAAK